MNTDYYNKALSKFREKMEGTMNWAQSGKIKKIIQYEEDLPALF